MKGNYIFVEQDKKCFKVSSNFTNYLELGIKGITKHYLEAKIEKDEFLISGILLDKKGDILCRLKDNFIEASNDYIKEMTRFGYRIKNQANDILFEIQANENICSLKGKLYGESGELIAEDKDDDFIVWKGPAIIGKSGNAIGIKLG
jgi:hypothetical protein